MTKRILVSFILFALLAPSGVFSAAYTPYPEQNIVINKTTAISASANVQLAELRSVNGQTFGISIFGNDYSVDVSGAQFLNAARAPISRDSFTIGKRININGSLDAANAFLIRAQIVRDPGATGTGGPQDPDPTDPDPTDPDPTDGELAPITDAMYDRAKNSRAVSTDPRVLNARWKRGSLSNWNQPPVGSQNIPMIAEAALGNYKFFADLARQEKQDGLYGREFGSPGFYFSFPFAAKMVGLRDARLAGDTSAAAEIAGSLEATLALWSLAAVNTPRRSETLKQSNRIITDSGNTGVYAGLSVAVSGERWPVGSVGPYDTDIILSWALDVPRNMTSGNSTSLRRTTDNPKWWNNAIAELAGTDNYSQTTNPAIWGLTSESRAKLQSIARGETTHLNWAISLIKGYGVWENSPIRIRRTSQGVETVFFNANNGNKPAQAATAITSQGVWSGLRPCVGSVGSNEGYSVTVVNGVITATGTAPRCQAVSQPELGGNIVYTILIEGKKITLNGKSVPDGGLGDPDPAPANSTGEAYAMIDDLLRLRKRIKDKTFQWEPHERVQIPALLLQMQRDIAALGVEIAKINQSDGDTLEAMARVQAKYTEFSAAALIPVFPTPGHVPGPYKTGVERTAGPLDDAFRGVKASLPAPVNPGPGDGGVDGDGGGGGTGDPCAGAFGNNCAF